MTYIKLYHRCSLQLLSVNAYTVQVKKDQFNCTNVSDSLQPKLMAKDLLDLVASHFNLKEKEYFGIAYTDET